MVAAISLHIPFRIVYQSQQGCFNSMCDDKATAEKILADKELLPRILDAESL